MPHVPITQSISLSLSVSTTLSHRIFLTSSLVWRRNKGPYSFSSYFWSQNQTQDGLWWIHRSTVPTASLRGIRSPDKSGGQGLFLQQEMAWNPSSHLLLVHSIIHYWFERTISKLMTKWNSLPSRKCCFFHVFFHNEFKGYWMGKVYKVTPGFKQSFIVCKTFPLHR